MANTKIQSEQIADSAIVTDRIAADAVTTAKIADNVALGGSPTTTTQSASDNSTKIATTEYVTTAISSLIDSAPSTLNTLNEIAAALNDDANFNTTVTNSIAAKLPLAGGTMTGALNMGTQNITNIGTISSGAITSSASIIASGNSNNFGNTTISNLSATSVTASGSITASGNSNNFGNTTLGTISSGAITSSAAVNADSINATSSVTTGYGLALTNGSTNYLLYSNTGNDVLYMRDTTNSAMVQAWSPTGLTFYKAATFNSTISSGQITANTGNSADVAFFDSTHATTTNFYIRNSRATTGNAAAIYLAPANNVAGAYVQAVATEDFSANANRSAKLVLGVRKDGTFADALTLADSKHATFEGNVGVKVPSLLPFRANSNEGAIQVGKRGVIYADTGITTQIGNNTYITSANQRVAIENDFGSFYEQYQGNHSFYSTTAAESVNALQTFVSVLQILKNGKVGISQSNPQETLHIGSGQTNFLRIHNAASGDVSSGINITRGDNLGVQIYDNPSDDTTTINASGHVNFRTDNTSYRLYIKDNGSVAVGSNANAGHSFEVQDKTDGYSMLWTGRSSSGEGRGITTHYGLLGVDGINYDYDGASYPVAGFTGASDNSSGEEVDFWFGSSTSEWRPMVFMCIGAHTAGGQTGQTAGWALIRATHYNNSISFNIMDSGGGGTWTTSVQGTYGADKTDVSRCRIRYSSSQNRTVLSVWGANYSSFHGATRA